MIVGSLLFCCGREQINKKVNPVQEAPRKNVSWLLLFCILMLYIEMSKTYHLIIIQFTVLSLCIYIAIAWKLYCIISKMSQK